MENEKNDVVSDVLKDGLTVDECMQIIRLASIMDNPYYTKNGFGAFTPYTSNEILKDKTVDERTPTIKGIMTALGNVNTAEDELVGYSQWFDVNSMEYSRIEDYLANILAFDLEVTCTNAHGKDYKSKEYLEDERIVFDFLDRLNYKREFKKVMRNILRKETVYTSFRYGEKYPQFALQELPSHYCKITGYTPYTMLIDFDMTYFLQPTVDIRTYDPVFRKYAREVANAQTLNTIPSNRLDRRNGIFSLWHQTSPLDGIWTWKLRPEIFATVPYLSPLMPEFLDNLDIRKLQKNKDFIAAKSLILGEIEFRDVKSGNMADQLKLQPETLSLYLSMVKRGLDDEWKIGGMPLKDLQHFQYKDENPNMYSVALRTTGSQAVSANRLIYADDRMSQMEIILATETDSNAIKPMYSQFNDFLNFYINSWTKKYKFNFEFFGIDHNFDREARLDRALKLADKGIVLPQKIQSAIGASPQSFKRMMEQAQHGDFSDLLVQLTSIHTGGSGAGSNGRPNNPFSAINTDSRDYDDSSL